jgi:hypothetical protein
LAESLQRTQIFGTNRFAHFDFERQPASSAIQDEIHFVAGGGAPLMQAVTEVLRRGL